MTTRIQTITFTALPNGVSADGRLKLSVFLAPRLSATDPSPTLSLFPDFVDLPSTAAAIVEAIQVRWGSGSVSSAAPDPHAPAFDTDLWQALFPSSCSVLPFSSTSFAANRAIRSYPATNIRRFLQGLYTSAGLAKDHTAYPTATALLADSALGKFASNAEDGHDTRAALANQIEDRLKSDNVVAYQPYAVANIGLDMTQVELLHQPRAEELDKNTDLTAPPVPTYDFHRGLALLGNHGQLLRRLGIVIDLLVTRPASYSSETTVGLDVGDWSPAYPLVTFLNQQNPPAFRTVGVMAQTRMRPSTFIASPRSALPDLNARRLRLDDEKYDVVDVDLDGGALKTIALADNVLRANGGARKSVSTPDTYSLPALRSEGLVVVEAGKAAAVQANLAHQKTLSDRITAGQAPRLDAEDLVRGYYIDIFDTKTGHWSPTCLRDVIYQANDVPAVRVRDEGPVTLAATSATKSVTVGPTPTDAKTYVQNVPDDTADILLPEVVAKWSGWSLVAPRPGKQLPIDNGDLTAAADTSQATTIKLGITTRVPLDGTRPKLPSLRFGRSYRIRARAADLAGNSEPFTDHPTDTLHVTAATVFGRYDPVPAPVVLPHEDGTPASSVRRMVIRSNYNTPSTATVPTIRHLAPPNASQLLVEQSGELDRDGRVSATFYAMLQARDGQRFDTSTNTRHLDPSGPTQDGSAQYVYTDSYVKVPYLPDPFSRGIGLYGLPFGTTSIGGQTPSGGNLQVPWGKSGATFETVLAHRLRLSEPANITTAAAYKAKATKVALGADAGHSQIDVYLPKASVVTIRVASTLDKDLDLKRLGIYNWLIQGADGTPLSGTPLTNLQAAMAAGLHWMVTPYEEITLVHAVRQPLLAPRWAVTNQKSELVGYRTTGETVVHLKGAYAANPRSTSEIHVLAGWTEPVDLLDEAGPRNQTTAAKAITVTFPKELKGVAATAATGGTIGTPIPVRNDRVPQKADADIGTHELHDHKHRVIDYTLEAMSAFAEEFVETTTASFAHGPISLSSQPLVDGYTRVAFKGTRGTPTGGDVIYVQGIDYAVNQPQPGSLKLLPGSAINPGAALDVRWLAGPITRSSTEGPAAGTTAVALAAQKATVNVLASARPTVPDIQYVMPAYAWQGWKASGTTKHTNVRSGNTLRVWLARPWFSSGDGEKLAVICPTGTVQPDAQDALGLHKDVTLIGQDPIWGTAQAAAKQKPAGHTQKILTATQANFPLAVSFITGGITIDGVPAPVAAAVHAVDYDADKGMWFSDIQINALAGSYTPFVQLALARYQLNALHSTVAPLVDLRCSHVRVAEIAQLSPSRTVTITNATTAGGAPTVTVAGPAYHSVFVADDQVDTNHVLTLPGPARMVCEVQQLRGDLDPAKFPDTAWQPYSQVVLNGTTNASSGIATWTGVPDLGTPRLRGPLRLVFTEYEQHRQSYPLLESGIVGDGRIVFTATYLMG